MITAMKMSKLKVTIKRYSLGNLFTQKHKVCGMDQSNAVPMERCPDICVKRHQCIPV
jgi:hypothetical protein